MSSRNILASRVTHALGSCLKYNVIRFKIIQGRQDVRSPQRYYRSLDESGREGTWYHLCVLVHLRLSTLLLVLRAWTISRDSSLQLSGFGNALALLALLWVLGDLRGVVSVVVGQSPLLAGGLVRALGLVLARIGLYWLACCLQ
jgi:hypothetical protein